MHLAELLVVLVRLFVQHEDGRTVLPVRDENLRALMFALPQAAAPGRHANLVLHSHLANREVADKNLWPRRELRARVFVVLAVVGDDQLRKFLGLLVAGRRPPRRTMLRIVAVEVVLALRCLGG